MTDAELDQRFNAAAEKVKGGFRKDPTDNEKLELYALFKQATVGDCNTPKPGLLDFTGKRKWSAWDAKRGASATEAKEAYIREVERQIGLYGLK